MYVAFSRDVAENKNSQLQIVFVLCLFFSLRRGGVPLLDISMAGCRPDLDKFWVGIPELALFFVYLCQYTEVVSRFRMSAWRDVVPI